MSIKLSDENIGQSLELLTALAKYGAAAMAARGKTEVENVAEIHRETAELKAGHRPWRDRGGAGGL